MEQVDPQLFELKADIVFPAVAHEHWTRASLLREQAARSQAEAAEEARTAALTLSELGLTVRDVRTLLGLSHQRAAQLIAEATAARTPAEVHPAPQRVSA